jgi:dTMP kinase
MSDGVFIVFEGLDGSGTTTQIALLKDWFIGEGAKFGKCVTTFEPTAGPAGSILRLALSRRVNLDPRAMALLFAADRADHVYKEDDGRQEPGIRYLISQGAHVLSDRYLLSSLAYQSLDLPIEWLYEINSRIIVPDIIVYLDVDPDESARRMKRGRFHQELYEAIETQRRVLAQYEKAISFLKEKGQRISRVDANLSETEVFQLILTEILPILDKD